MTAFDRKDELSDKAEGWSKSPHKSFGYKQEKSLIIQMGNSNSFPKVIKRAITNLDPGQTPEAHQETHHASVSAGEWQTGASSHIPTCHGVFTKLLQ